MAAAPPQTMIRLERVSKQYGDTTAVAELSLAVAEGELLMLLGGSGSGKTTTLKMINRLIEPSAGRILIAGRDTAELRAFELRREIGYVFQRIGLFPHLTVAENIGITPSLLGWEGSRTAARVDELLELVELDTASLRSRYPSELSGGQAQRVAVARALAAAPRLLLLDEPFGALDPLVRDRLQQTLLRLRKQLRLTAVFVTHDVTEALLLGDRIGVMQDGRLLQIGTASELRAAPASDYVRDLMWTPERQLEILRGALGIGGASGSGGPA
jgi:osmoprotectant transport system ATP-binding protein